MADESDDPIDGKDCTALKKKANGIEPSKKKSWLPQTKRALRVSIFVDSNLGLTRVWCSDGDKVLINSVLGSGMVFTKTSQKFGQWSDPNADTVYGLGFQSEVDLEKFSRKFEEAKIRSEPADFGGMRSSSSNSTPIHNGVIASPVRSVSSNSTASAEDELTQSTGSHRSSSSASDLQMKYENDRLKAALAQSSSNAKKWETEFQTLKNNNARLTAALQESTVNVEKWKEQLSNYKEENALLRKKLAEAESEASSTSASNTEANLDERVVEYERKLRRKEEEILRLSQHGSGEVNILREKNSELQHKIRMLETEIAQLRSAIHQKDEAMKTVKSNETKMNEMREIHATTEERLKQMMELQKRMATLMKN